MKRLYRTRNDRWIAGVAGGLGEYFGIDPTLVRLMWIVLLIPGGLPGILPYLICWIVIPREPVAPPVLLAATVSTEPTPAPSIVLPPPASDTTAEAAR